MIKNHLLDPESSPMIGQNEGYSYYENDPWYNGSGSGRESPAQSPVHPRASQGVYQPMSQAQGSGQPFQPYLQSFLGNPAPQGQVGIDEDYENEPPLLEELGIRFDHIWAKTQAVMYPTSTVDDHILDDSDLAGPVFYCLLLGSCLLLSGKIHFGYIYGFSVFGCLGLHAMLNLLHHSGLDFWRTCSVLGYCLIPVIVLAVLSIFFKLTGILGLSFACIAIAWATFSAVRIFDAKLQLTEQYWLVAYPVVLLYSCFVLITIF